MGTVSLRMNWRKSSLSFFVFLFFLYSFLPVLIAYSLPDFQISWLACAMYLCILVESFFLAWLSVTPVVRPVSIGFFVFAYIFLGVSAMLQVGENRYPWLSYYGDYEIFFCFFAILLGIISFVLGWHVYFSKLISREREGRKGYFFLRFDSRKVFYFSLLFLPLIAFCVQEMGGVVRLLTPRAWQGELMEYNSVDYVLLNNGMYVPSVVFCIIFLFLYANRKRAPIGLYGYLGAVLWTITGLVICNPIGTTRYVFGALFGSILFLFTAKRQWVWILSLVLAMLILFPFADMFRDSNKLETSNLESPFYQLVEKPDYDSFQQVMNVQKHVDHHGYEDGRQLLGVLLFFVPRSIWDDKPVATGELVGSSEGYDYLNLSMPLWGEFLVDGGVTWLILGFLMYGFICAKMDSRVALSDDVSTSRLFSFYFGAYQIFFLRGSLLVTFAYLMPFILLFKLCERFCTKKEADWFDV